MKEKILFDEEKPTKDGIYITNRGDLEYITEINHFLDESGFPIYSDDKIKWWMKSSTENKINYNMKQELETQIEKTRDLLFTLDKGFIEKQILENQLIIMNSLLEIQKGLDPDFC